MSSLLAGTALLLAVATAPAGAQLTFYGCDTFTPGLPGPGPYACGVGFFGQSPPIYTDPDRPGVRYAYGSGGGTITFNTPGRIVGFPAPFVYQILDIGFNDTEFAFQAFEFFPSGLFQLGVEVEYYVGTPNTPDFRVVPGFVALNVVPEPSTAALVATGALALLGVGAVRRRRAS